MKQIKSQEELDIFISKAIKEGDGVLECCVLLMGCLRSSRLITFEDSKDKEYWVNNLIDDSVEIIKHSELKDTIIREAISKGAFHLDD